MASLTDQESTMQYPAFVRTAAAVLVAAAATGSALAQRSAPPAGTTTPTPQVMTDVAPLPPQERESIGAIVYEEAPVLAKRAYLEQLARESSAVDTRTMGAGPAPGTSRSSKAFMRQPAPTAEEILRAAEEADRLRKSAPAR
jgi:hypothetical protein